ncbi:MAG: dynamin family protein [Ectothiorhodospiraceae bacterium]|nr:dynamin family protein [Ectothiorhodospiraceae bacterium]
MSTESLHPNVQDFQQDTINLLHNIEEVMCRASNLLNSDASSKTGNKYAEFQKEVSEAKQNVEDLELRMAIVAPMKAGKSTIINAIVGQYILPSRASAMTTLPTEIIFSSNETQPVLTLDKSTVSCLRSSLLNLQQKINRDGSDKAVTKIEKYPHLTELIPKIQNGFLIQPETIGLQGVQETLTDLNDIVRVSTVLDRSTNPLNLVDFHVPCIHTPFWKATDTRQAKSLGNLVIVDTPGPNEAGDNLGLSAVVQDQLRRSSMVLIVLDFTQLNNQAAEEIKRQVKPVIELLGKENLYVLVNKVDQRTEKDPMTSEKVKQFVLADLGLGKSSDNDAERVFEVAAKWAFCAASFLVEMQHYPNIQKEEMRTARALAEQVFGMDWEEELEDCSLERLQKKAQRLWRKSGFEPFLEKSINVLMETAAPRCIKSALNLSRNRLEELSDDVQLRASAIAKDGEKLRLEVGALEEDLKHLEACRERLKEVDKIKNQLQKRLERLLIELKKTAKVSLEDYASKDTRKNHGQGGSPTTLWGSLALIVENLKSPVEAFTKDFQPSGVFKFGDKYRAEKFADQAVAYAQQRVEILLSKVREETTQEVEKARSELMSFLEKETNPIVERARTRLNQSFNITLSLSPLDVDISENISVNRPSIKSNTEVVSQGYENVTVKKRVFWTLWIFKVNVTEQRKLPDRTKNYYTVSLKGLIPEINKSTEASITAIEESLNKYLDDDFQQRVDQFFNSLDAYLSNYRDSLKQAQEDQRLAVEDKKALIHGFNSIVPEATEQIKKCNTYAERANSLIKGQ